MGMKPVVICFASVPTGGKTTMAYFLSENFGLPIFSTDAVRYDTKAATSTIDINEVIDQFSTNRQARANAMFARKKSFIYDGSVDRRWADVKKEAQAAGFTCLLISFDISKEKIDQNRKMQDRIETDELFNKWFADHEKFLSEHGTDVQLHITDDNYAQRYTKAKELVKTALNS